MKGYVGVVFEIPESIEVGNRCVESGKQFGIDVEIVPAVYKEQALDVAVREGLKLSKWDESYSNVGAVVGNFITQYRIWKFIFARKEPAIVLEHDAVFIDKIPDIEGKGEIINLGKPSYGNYRKQNQPGVYPMFSKPGGYIPGAHGYYVTPKGAQELINKAESGGIAPADIFLNKNNFPNIKEIYPWVIEAHDEFSTIQKEKGCLAKHNYNNNFKVI